MTESSKTVNIVMPIYNPNMLFLEKQLESLNNQTYANISLLFIDDCSKNIDGIETVIKKTITRFPYKFMQNERNIGSNKTFEKLTELSNTDFIAFCDQDDIWLEDKIDVFVKKAVESNSILVYSDLEVINEDDVTIYKSFRECRKRLVHKEGNDLWKYFIRMNSITGCAMMIKTDIAKRAIPFPEEMYVWDQWLSIFGAIAGKVTYISSPMIRYRLHSNNQIGAKNLINIENKQQYIERRVKVEIERCELLLSRISDNNIHMQIQTLRSVVQKRLDYLEKPTFVNFLRNIGLIFNDFKLLVLETLISLDKKNNGSKIISYIKRSNY